MHACEHFIPVRQDELVEVLCGECGVAGPDADRFGRLCRLVNAVAAFEHYQRLVKLKAAYAPFDPDADTVPLQKWTAEHKQQRLNALFTEFTGLMERADFTHLTVEDIEPALQQASDSGMRMDVDFKVFERLALFARGHAVEKRKRRRARRRWRAEEVEVPVYRRLVMIFKLRPHPRLGKHVDTQSVYFQLFKNIPRLNIAMLLPGARARISLLDRGKISVSLLSGLALTVWRFLKEVWHSVQEIFFFQDPIALWILASGAVGYGVKSYFGYQQTKQRYTLTLTQVLYYQNLDTNAGVVYRLLNEGEEQMCREVILGYYFLWRHAGEPGWTGRELQEAVEKDLERRANLHVGFEVKDALRHLTRLGLVEPEGERYRAVPLERAVEALEHFWEGCVRTMGPQEVVADARIRR